MTCDFTSGEQLTEGVHVFSPSVERDREAADTATKGDHCCTQQISRHHRTSTLLGIHAKT